MCIVRSYTSLVLTCESVVRQLTSRAELLLENLKPLSRVSFCPKTLTWPQACVSNHLDFLHGLFPCPCSDLQLSVCTWTSLASFLFCVTVRQRLSYALDLQEKADASMPSLSPCNKPAKKGMNVGTRRRWSFNWRRRSSAQHAETYRCCT